jgi:radical SAM superfamily enzyme YgiQ (UPF0313 family)
VKALLVLPRYADALWTYKHVRRFLRKKASSPPLGLLIVAALLPQEWQKKFVDLNVNPLDEADLADADIVFIGAMLAQQASALEVIARCRRKGKKIVAGGPLFCPDLIAQGLFKDVDHIVVGEAEALLPILLADLANGCAHPMYRAEEFPDIRQVPVPMWSLVNLKDYAVANLQFVRGCPYHCEFCYGHILNGNRPRAKTLVQITAELDALYRAGWRGMIFVCDDNLVGNKHLARTQVLPAMIDWMQAHDYPFSLMGAASVDLAGEPDLMDMLVKAGFESVTLGIESTHASSLEEVQKVQNQRVNLMEAVHIIQQRGLEVQAGMILGFDHDPPSIFQEHIDFLQQSGIANALVSLLFAFPDTPLYDRLRREGRLVPYTVGDCVHGAINFAPKMPLETLERGYKRVLAALYSPRGYYDRLEAFLRRYQPAPRRLHVRKGDLVAVLRALHLMGIQDPYRWRFWRLFLYALRKAPDALVAFMRLAISGYFLRDDILEFVEDWDCCPVTEYAQHQD